MKLKLLFALLIMSLAAQSQLKYAIDTNWRRQVGWVDAKKGFTPPRGIAFPASLNNLNLPEKGSMFIDTVLHRIGIWNGSSFTIIGEGGGGIGTETDPVWTSEKGSYLTSAIAAATYATAASVAGKLNASDTPAMLDPYKHWTFGYLTEAAADLRYTSQSTFNARNIFNLPGIDTAGLEGDYLLLYDSASQTFKAVAFPSRYDLSRADSGLQVYNSDAVVNHNGLLLWKGRADALYPSLTGSYANPAWITSLAWSKISGAPSFLTSYTETDPVWTAEKSSYLTSASAAATYAALAGSYANPSWITSLAWSKLTGVPSTFTPAAHTHTLSNLTQSGATTGQVAQWNGTAWAPATISGSGAPGGSSAQVQYNDGGSFAGAANVDIEGGQLRVDDVPNPTAPASGGIKIYSKNIAGNSIPYVKTPDGVETAVQPSLFMGKMPVWVGFASGTTAPVTMGGTIATAATMGTANPASTNEWTKYQRKTYTTSTTAGNQSGLRQSYTQFSSATGGFFAHFKFGQTIALNGEQKFIGMCASTAALGGDASALTNIIGMGIDAADVNGNWYLMYNDGTGTATRVDLGANAVRNTTDGYELNIYVGPGSSTYYVYIKNLATGADVYNGSLTTDVPASSTLLAWKAECRNGAVAAATNLHMAATYIQPL